MKKYIIFSMLTLAICSCDINLDDDAKHYRFMQEDYEFIPIAYQNVNRIITFKNQEDEEV